MLTLIIVRIQIANFFLHFISDRPSNGVTSLFSGISKHPTACVINTVIHGNETPHFIKHSISLGLTLCKGDVTSAERWTRTWVCRQTALRMKGSVQSRCRSCTTKANQSKYWGDPDLHAFVYTACFLLPTRCANTFCHVRVLQYSLSLPIFVRIHRRYIYKPNNSPYRYRDKTKNLPLRWK
mgnify:CR=1 FL=1